MKKIKNITVIILCNIILASILFLMISLPSSKEDNNNILNSTTWQKY